MKKVVIASNMLNEISQLPEWIDCFSQIADGGMLIVDSGSTDGTIEYATKKGINVFVDDIIQREGYGPARNQLRKLAKQICPDAEWMAYFDADERMMPEDFHQFRNVKDSLIDIFDVVAFPRIDWKDSEMKEAAKDWRINPDWQARMSRLNTPIIYVRKLHEQITQFKGIYAKDTNPKIHHFHRTAGQEKRDFIGKVCAKLHMEDEQWGATYPEHHKEAKYRELFLKEGL